MSDTPNLENVIKSYREQKPDGNELVELYQDVLKLPSHATDEDVLRIIMTNDSMYEIEREKILNQLYKPKVKKVVEWKISSFDPKRMLEIIEREKLIDQYDDYLDSIIMYRNLYHWTVETKDDQLKAFLILMTCGKKNEYIPKKSWIRKVWIRIKRSVGYQDIPTKRKGKIK